MRTRTASRRPVSLGSNRGQQTRPVGEDRIVGCGQSARWRADEAVMAAAVAELTGLPSSARSASVVLQLYERAISSLFQLKSRSTSGWG